MTVRIEYENDNHIKINDPFILWIWILDINDIPTKIDFDANPLEMWDRIYPSIL